MLNTFESQPLSDEEGDANNLEEEAANFSIKYLTSSKLMSLEVSSSENWAFTFWSTIELIFSGFPLGVEWNS